MILRSDEVGKHILSDQVVEVKVKTIDRPGEGEVPFMLVLTMDDQRKIVVASSFGLSFGVDYPE